MTRLLLVLVGMGVMVGCGSRVEPADPNEPTAFVRASATSVSGASGNASVLMLRHIASGKCLAVLIGYSKGAIASVPDEVCR